MTNEEIKNLIMLEVIAPNSNESGYFPKIDTSDVDRHRIYSRYKQGRAWSKVFEPIRDVGLRNALIELFEELDGEK